MLDGVRLAFLTSLALLVSVACSGDDEGPGSASGGASFGGASTGGHAGTGGSAGGGGNASGGGSAGGGAGSGGSTTTGGTGGGAPIGPTRYPEGDVTSPLSDHVAKRLRAIASQNATRKGDVFMKVGDSHTVSKNLMYCFAGPAQPSYQLDLAGNDALLPSIQHFRSGSAAGKTPFDRASLAAVVGKTASWSITGSPSPLNQETAALNPRFALVSYGTNDMQMGVTFASALWPFYESMSKLLDQLEQGGVVPIVAGLLPRGDSPAAALWAEVYDHVTRALAEKRQLPYLSVYRATKDLPKQGLAADSLHGNVYVAGTSQPCVFAKAGLDFNYNVRNLHSMRQLDVVKRLVIDDAQAPDVGVPMPAGAGTAADPVVVDALPFTHHASTQGSPSSVIDAYPGCNSAANESGPERFYTLTLTETTPIRAMLFDREGVDVDLHLLSGGTTGAHCQARHDRLIETTLGPGTYSFVVDSFTASGAVLSGEYTLVVMRCASSDAACN
jgi:hypothetical protein